MTFGEILQKVFSKKQPEPYMPQREFIDRRHDNLQRQESYYRKKIEIPKMEARIRRMEKEHFGSTMHTKDENNILKVPNMMKDKNRFKWNDRGMLR